MVSKVLNVFYGSDYLPYKDSERTVHFPIGGGTFAGSQNTFRIRFYVKDIGGASGITWVLVSKLPNGELGYQILTAIGTDNVLGEQYVETDISSYYTQYKGVVKLALRGYQGEVSFVEDEETSTYSVVGTPLIGVTGTIDIAINYSPMVYGSQFLPSELDRILAALDECVKNGSVIIRVASLDDIDLDSYEYGQLFYVSGLDRYYIYDENDGLKPFGNMGLNGVPFYVTLLPSVVIKTFFDNSYNRPFITNVDSSYLFSIKILANTNKEITAIRLSDMHYFVATLTEGEYATYTIAQLLSSGNEYEFASKDYVNTKVQEKITLSGTGGVLSTANLNILLNNESAFIELGGSIYNLYRKSYVGGNLTTLSYWTDIAPTISSNVLQNNTESISVNISTRNWQLTRITRNAATPTYVDNAIQEFLQNEYTKVNTTTYPTLNSFLASTGEEGYIYLYPIDTSDESKGYYQYIWENNSWVSLGSTNIDLSGYVEKTNSANKVYGTNELGAQTTYTVDDFYDGNIARRDSDGSITVPLTPSANGEAASKKYVDDQVNNLSNEVDDKLEDKANVDGNYPTLTAGLADNLTPYSEDSGASQDNPFISNGTGTNNNTEIVTVGDYGLLKEKQGNTVVVNQWFNKSDFGATDTINGITFTNNNDGTISVSGTATDTASYSLGTVNLNGKRYLLFGSPSSSTDNNYFLYDAFNGNKANANGKISAFRSGGGNVDFKIRVTSGTAISGTVTFKPQLVCVDQMFNGNIPQDLLDNPSHFSWYYNGSLAYNTGSLVNANGVKLVSTGRQLWDEKWDNGYLENGNNATGTNTRSKNYLDVMPNAEYRLSYLGNISSVAFNVSYYDNNKNYIGSSGWVFANNTITTQSNCRYIRFFMNGNYGTTYNHDITISLYYSPEQGGEGYDKYYPYEAPYVVDTGTEVLRKAGSVKDYKEPNGTIHRLVYEDTVAITYMYTTSGNENFDFAIFQVDYDWQRLGNILSEKCDTQFNTSFSQITKNNAICIYSTNNRQLAISVPKGTTLAQAQALYNGMKVQYPLLNPTTEQGTPFAENLPINDYGMLYWLDSSNNLVGIPQGAKIFYPTNYKGFVDDMYSRVDGDSSKFVIDEDLQPFTDKDTQLLNAIGGTLRQCLCIKESLDFDNTSFVDLSLQSITYDGSNQIFIITISNLKHNNYTSKTLLCTKYKVDAVGLVSITDKSIRYVGDSGSIYLKDLSYNAPDTLRASLKGVLLAYEKA